MERTRGMSTFKRFNKKQINEDGLGLGLVHWTCCDLDTYPILIMCPHLDKFNTLKHWTQFIPHENLRCFTKPLKPV